MKKFTPLLIIVFSFAVEQLAVAQSLTDTEAQTAAQHWVNQNTRLIKQVSPFYKKRLAVQKMKKRQFSDVTLPYYIIKLEPEGFVIMNSDKRLPPVLAFSNKGSLNLDEAPHNTIVALLKNSLQKAQLKLSQTPYAGFFTSITPSNAYTDQWDTLLAEESSSLTWITQSIGDTNGPLLTTTWNQNNHYNELCPIDPSASDYYDGHAPAGCVAIVAAQILNYYQWPYRGSEQHSYTDSIGSMTGYHSVDFSDPYDWSNLQDNYYAWGTEPQAAVDAISELVYELGACVDMDYESAGSSSSTYDLNNALNRWFFYEKGNYLTTNSTTIATLLKSEILASHPAIVSIPGHAVVADGYTEQVAAEYFHVNYGWGGQNDAWYLIDDITSQPAVSCVTGIYPALVPLNITPSGTTNVGSNITLEWALPAVRTAEAQSLDVLERQLNTSTFSDSADDFSNFEITSTADYKDWSISSSGYAGNCFFKTPGGYSNREYHLTSIEKFIPANGSTLSFRLKAWLGNDIFRVMISNDNGQNWSSQYSLTSYYNSSLSWQLVSVDLSSYASSEILIRFEYISDSYYSDGGIWIDNIQFTNGSWYDWATLKTITSGIATGSTTISGLDIGTHTLAFRASNGSWGPQSSSFDIIVMEQGIDVDQDGIPDEWEAQYFGGTTNASATIDSDSDGMNNLQEYISGFDPTNASSCFTTTLSETPQQLNVGSIIEWTAYTGRHYSVEWSTNLLYGFQSLATNLVWPQSSYTDTLHNAESENFYKLNVQLISE